MYLEPRQYTYNPKLLPELWLYAIAQNLSIDHLYFDWAAALGIRRINTTCETFAQRNGIPSKLSCKNIPHITFHGYVNSSLSSLDRELLGSAYISNSPRPRKIVFTTRDGLFEYTTTGEKYKYNASLAINAEYVPGMMKSQKLVSREVESSRWDVPTAAQCKYDKYFYEAEPHQDWRFYRVCDHRPVIHRTARAWFRFARNFGIQTWLAHGLALGWYWHRMNLPWDDDLDVQVSFSSLERLVEFNQTIVYDFHDSVTSSAYLIDVNRNIYCRENDSANVIDARFIDVFSGYFVDITALSWVEHHTNSTELSQLIEPSFKEYSANPTVDHQEMLSSITVAEKKLIANHQLLSDKDYHFYAVNEILPLHNTMFEGVVVHVPNKIESILQREYPRGFLYRKYEGRVFEKGTWKKPGEDTTRFQAVIDRNIIEDLPPVW